MIHAVLFDMDGTITDTERIYNRIWVEAAKQLGYHSFTREDALDLRSLNHQDSAALLQSRFGDSMDYDRLHTLCGSIVDAYLEQNGIPLKPGLDDILSYLKEHHIKAAIVTATGIERATQRLASIGYLDRFDDVISAHQVQRGKPHPDPYLFACQKIDASPAQCIAVEDSPNGAASAIAAGCKTIMVPDLTPPDPALRQQLYAVCETLADIRKYI